MCAIMCQYSEAIVIYKIDIFNKQSDSYFTSLSEHFYDFTTMFK